MAAWSPTGWRLATATANSMPMNPKEYHSRDFTLRIWDPTAQAHPAPLTMDATEGYQWPYVGWCEFVDHEHVLTTVRGWAGDPARRFVTLWHVGKGAAVRRQSFDGAAITACALDRARGRLWVATEGGAVYAADPMLATAPRAAIAGGGPTGHIELEYGVCGLALAPASGVVAVASTDGAIWRIDPAGTATAVSAYAEPDQRSRGLRVRAASGWFATMSDGVARAWPVADAAAGRLSTLAGQLASRTVERIDDFVPLPGDDVVVAARIAGAPALLHCRADGSPPRSLRLTLAAPATIDALDASDDGRWLAVACSDGRMRAFDLARADPAPVGVTASGSQPCRHVRVRTGLDATPAYVAVVRGDRLMVFAIDG